MTALITLAQLARRTNLAVRRLQYVCDHAVVPGVAGKGHGFGVARTFTDDEAYAIALAGYLLDAGYARKLVAAVLRVASAPTRGKGPPARSPLYQAWHGGAPTLEIGDGYFLRLRADPRPGLSAALDTGWLPLHPKGSRLRSLDPVVGTRVDLARIIRAVHTPDEVNGPIL